MPRSVFLDVMTAEVRGEIWKLFLRVTKRMKSRIIFGAKVRALPGTWSRRMIVSNSSIWQKELKSTRDVMYPSDIDWFGRHFKLAVQQKLVKAVARPKHQLVCSKPHRLLVPVCCRVVYGENSHQLPDFRDLSMIGLYGTRDPGQPSDTLDCRYLHCSKHSQELAMFFRCLLTPDGPCHF
jgi:hypothetical protein